MGRYFNSNNFDGKFAFAVQSSTDPEIFGMEEQPPTEITYYLSGYEDNKENIEKILDEQYDILGYPKEKRIYEIEKQEELDPLYDDLSPYVYKCVKTEEVPKGIISYGGGNGWWKLIAPKELHHLSEVEFNQKYSIIPKSNQAPLAQARITLGIKILSDLRKDDYCELYAEL